VTRTTILSGKRLQNPVLLPFSRVGQTGGTTLYFSFGNNNYSRQADETCELVPMPRAGIFCNLAVYSQLAQGAGKTSTVTLRKNRADTAVTVSLTNSTGPGYDFTHEVEVAKGDLISFSVIISTAATMGEIHGSIEFHPLG